MTAERGGSTRNGEIWGAIYGQGHMLWYPYDIVVRVVHHLKNTGRLDGTILDHGCGSGNHLELLVRLGLGVVGTDVVQSSLDVVRARFAGAKLPLPPLSLVDPGKALGEQLPRYDHVLAWGSTHYNRKGKFLRDLADLIEGLPAGGSLIFAIPSMDDVVGRHSVREPDGTFRITAEVSGQQGALVCIPGSREELLGWCGGIEVEECARFGWTFRGMTSDYFFLYGRKAP